MGKRILFGNNSYDFISFHTRAFSYDEIDKIAIEVEKLLLKGIIKDLVIDCLKVEENSISQLLNWLILLMGK